MSIDFKLHIRHLVTALLLLPLLCACSSEDDATDATPVIATANDYINLNFVVSTGEENVMRAPFGGEDGDGREVGSKSENAVEGITLMLYQDDAGINTKNATTTIAYAKYFPVTLSYRNNNVGSSITDPKDEAVYTTGDQSLGNSQLDLTKNYHAIVVANQDLTSLKGETVQKVRDHLVTSLYEGAKVGNDAWSFVMSLERDVELNFANTTSKVTTTSGKTYYTFDNIYIERLAARVDFWTQNADYNGTLKGYEYKVYKDASATEQSGDKFVLTGITPFNLLTSGEYLIKRTNDASNPYLAQETWENYVKDPKWADKPTYAYANPLSGLATKSTLKDVTPYYQSTEMLHGNNAQKASFVGDGGKENFILCYPMENTLERDARLYDYATGLAIEGDYYEEGWEDETETPNPKIKHLVYYGYLRHQGENTNTTGSYPIYSKDKLDKNQTGSTTTAMNFGVVRNNIYRVSIGTITEKREVQLVIKVKMWDTFIHDVIYM